MATTDPDYDRDYVRDYDRVCSDVTRSIREVFNQRKEHIVHAGPSCCKGCELAVQVPWLLDEIDRLRALAGGVG